MLKNYIKIALRNLVQDRFYASLNIFGLTVGLTCFILIFLYIQHELSYEKHFSEHEKIYRVCEIIASEGGGENSASCPVPLGTTIVHDHSDLVETQTRFFNFQSPKFVLSVGEESYVEKKLFIVDSTIFKVFDYEFAYGDRTTAFNEPRSVVMTKSAAVKYFGRENAVGELIKPTNFWDVSLKVTGIIDDSEGNSHLDFNVLVNFSTIPRGPNDRWWENNYYWNPAWTYVKLKPGIEAQTLEARFPGLISKYFPDHIQDVSTLYLMPLKDIHLKSQLDFEMHPNSDITYIYIFSVVAALVLIIACVNFVNLATARTSKRAREVGMRKVLGAHRLQLIWQFLGETLFQAFISLILAIVFSELLLNPFNGFSGKTFNHNFIFDPFFLTVLLFIWLIVGMLSGMYPAFYLSNFQPVKVLKSNLGGSTKRFSLRSILVVFQFAISMILISGTIVSYMQLGYLQEAKLGFDKEQILIVPFNNGLEMTRWDAMRKKLTDHEAISEMTTSAYMLGDGHQTDNYIFSGQNEAQQIAFLGGGENFCSAYGLEVLVGQDFNRSKRYTALIPAIVNEALVKHLGWESPEAAINQVVRKRGGRTLQVEAVVKDFHFSSLHNPISPVVIEGPRVYHFGMGGTYMAIRFDGKSYQEVIEHTEVTLGEFFPETPFEYTFLDNNLDALYRTENVMTRVITSFSAFAILVACLGLLGLTSYTAEQRTREIGIRKVLGATEGNLIFLLGREFFVLVAISFLIALPISHLGLTAWLEDFAYRVEISWWIYIFAGITASVIAMVTVGLQAYRASTINPVESLSADS